MECNVWIWIRLMKLIFHYWLLLWDSISIKDLLNQLIILAYRLFIICKRTFNSVWLTGGIHRIQFQFLLDHELYTKMVTPRMCLIVFRNQALPMWDLPTKVHATVSLATTYTNAHRGQAVQVSSSWMQQGLFAIVESSVSFPMSPNGQAIQVQLLLQVFHWRGLSPWPHP